MKNPVTVRVKPEKRDRTDAKDPEFTASLSFVIMVSETPPTTPRENITDTFFDSANALQCP